MLGFIKRILPNKETENQPREANPFMSERPNGFWISSSDGEVWYFCHIEEGLLECPRKSVSDD